MRGWTHVLEHQPQLLLLVVGKGCHGGGRLSVCCESCVAGRWGACCGSCLDGRRASHGVPACPCGKPRTGRARKARERVRPPGWASQPQTDTRAAGWGGHPRMYIRAARGCVRANRTSACVPGNPPPARCAAWLRPNAVNNQIANSVQHQRPNKRQNPPPPSLLCRHLPTTEAARSSHGTRAGCCCGCGTRLPRRAVALTVVGCVGGGSLDSHTEIGLRHYATTIYTHPTTILRLVRAYSRP